MISPAAILFTTSGSRGFHPRSVERFNSLLGSLSELTLILLGLAVASVSSAGRLVPRNSVASTSIAESMMYEMTSLISVEGAKRVALNGFGLQTATWPASGDGTE
jgi:hypothetical protein